MPLEPRVRRIVQLLNLLDRGSSDASMAQRRRASAAFATRLGFLVMPKGPAPASTVDRSVPVAGGQILVRVHRPHGPGPFPLHVFLHGGGWCVGTIAERDPRCRAISAGAGCVVASVDYRLAPENAYPTPGEDSYAALLWLVAHAAELDIDAARISVGGESAGGNLAAVLTLMARDRSGPAICHQWLDVPATDLTLAQPSVRSVPDGNLLDRSSIDRYLAAYLTDPAQATEPYASPLLDPDLRGLPPAWIMSAEHDKLRDDGRAYADALAAAGVPVAYRRLDGHVHPSFAFTRLLPSAKAYEADAIAALRAAYERA
ncbi:alpha/beta hydrolase [Aquihabitans sp. G128]|uniref:alpha/beta hydrolase n=1 Tax=Aquihabitans sp. G128 TaxID=2849779 RepID=UPI001C22F133|nr:alpha/beta hydrolase [Aquihabitans sp. G128]QXC61908.1 alpha/beta hydrolase [Aquihabitans sp. G128]